MVNKKNVNQGVRTVALFEALKGMIVLLAGCGLLVIIHDNAQHVAEEIVRHFHLNPASKYPRIFLDLASHQNNLHLWQMAGLALAYAGIRFIEAFGLWRQRRWAEWFSVISGGIYIPIEVYEIVVRISWAKIGMLMLNLLIVAYMTHTIIKNKKSH